MSLRSASPTPRPQTLSAICIFQKDRTATCRSSYSSTGGGWAQKSNLEYAGAWAKTLTPYGIAVWNIEYRRVGGQGGWPTTLSDTVTATNALAGIVQEKASGRLDLSRVHIAGYSAGGQLAAWVASRSQQGADAPAPDLSVPVRSATIMAGVFDMTLAATAGKDRFVRNLLGRHAYRSS